MFPSPHQHHVPHVSCVPVASAEHARDCEQLAAHHGAVAYVHSVALARARSRPRDRWCRVLDTNGTCMAGGVLTIDRSRKLPWVKLARLPQATELLHALDDHSPALWRAIAAAEPQIAELTVQTYAVHERELDEQGTQLERAGFTRLSSPRNYVNSLRLSLDGTSDTLFGRLSASARRNVRQVTQHGYAVRPVTDESFAPRLAELLALSHERTGGRAGDQECSAMIRAAAADPASSIVLGVFHPARTGARALVGFAQGTRAPSAATYAVAGTERAEDIGRTPLSYGLVWALLEWGQQLGLPWFDFGGVTDPSQSDDPLAGISDFKRKFGGEACRIADEYLRVLNPVQQRLLRLAGHAAHALPRFSLP